MFARLDGSARATSFALLNTGWVLMVSGFSMTLYSRVHLVVTNRKVLRLLLAVIILNGCIVHIPAIITGYIARHARLQIINKLEIACYVQEIFLSSLYTFQFGRFARQDSSSLDYMRKKTLCGLVVGQVVVLGCDISMAILLFSNFYLARKLILPLNYALKILVEFFVLNQLVAFASGIARNGEVHFVENILAGLKREDEEALSSSRRQI